MWFTKVAKSLFRNYNLMKQETITCARSAHNFGNTNTEQDPSGNSNIVYCFPTSTHPLTSVHNQPYAWLVPSSIQFGQTRTRWQTPNKTWWWPVTVTTTCSIDSETPTELSAYDRSCIKRRSMTCYYHHNYIYFKIQDR